MLVAGLSPDGAFGRDGKLWTTHDEIVALSTEILASLWAEKLPEQLIAHPHRPKPKDTRLRTSDPAQIVKFLTGR